MSQAHVCGQSLCHHGVSPTHQHWLFLPIMVLLMAQGRGPQRNPVGKMIPPQASMDTAAEGPANRIPFPGR